MTARRGRRAAGILWFIAVTLPVLFFLGAMSTDTMRVISGNRQAGQLADAAALAGATQFADQLSPRWDGTGLRLDPFAVEVAVAEYIDRAANAGVAPLLQELNVEQRLSVVNGVDTVEVTVEYTVDDLVFYNLVTGNRANREVTGSVTRSAAVCQPGFGSGIDGICRRPRD